METTPEEEKVPTEEAATTNEAPSRLAVFLLFIGANDKRSRNLLIVVLSIVLLSTVFSFLTLPPFGFPQNKTLTIRNGATLADVSALFANENIIRSQRFFELCARIVGGEKPILAGQYAFNEPISACAVAIRVARGISGIPAVRITIPEGMSNKEMAAVFEKNIPSFDTAAFLEIARSQEGFLFPDTYFVREDASVQEVQELLAGNFNKRIEAWKGEIESSGHTLREIVIMASILEKEAQTDEDKALVAGILWKRISLGMPLQVDATFMYLLGKKSSELTAADLQMKSAYNTYRNKGLPGGPIGNPGIKSIRAAIHPTTSPYLYYLSDDEGAMHYAKTFTEHKTNKEKYLR